jgi:hypothetical protein
MSALRTIVEYPAKERCTQAVATHHFKTFHSRDDMPGDACSQFNLMIDTHIRVSPLKLAADSQFTTNPTPELTKGVGESATEPPGKQRSTTMVSDEDRGLIHVDFDTSVLYERILLSNSL